VISKARVVFQTLEFNPKSPLASAQRAVDGAVIGGYTAASVCGTVFTTRHSQH
jgi:hypothetical protein